MDDKEEEEESEVSEETRLLRAEAEKEAYRRLNLDKDKWMLDKFEGLPLFKNLSNYGDPDE